MLPQFANLECLSELTISVRNLSFYQDFNSDLWWRWGIRKTLNYKVAASLNENTIKIFFLISSISFFIYFFFLIFFIYLFKYQFFSSLILPSLSFDFDLSVFSISMNKFIEKFLTILSPTTAHKFDALTISLRNSARIIQA